MAKLAEDFWNKLADTFGDPSAFSELVFGTKYHAGQSDYALHATHDVNFLLPGNYWGKTEYIVRQTLYEAWFKIGPDTPTDMEDWLHRTDNSLLASYEYDTIDECYQRYVRYIQQRAEVDALIENNTASPTPVIKLVNGARIDFGSLKDQGKHVEATRYNRIKIDEAGHIPDISYTFDSVLFPRTMGVGGRIDLIGTPKPHSDPFLLEVFEKGKAGDDPFYYSKSGSVLENEFWTEAERKRILQNPRYVKGWVPVKPNEELGILDKAVTIVNGVPSVPVLTPMGRQVILGHFILAGGFFFNRAHINRMFQWDDSENFFLDPNRNGDSFAFPARRGRTYMAAFDIAGNKPRTLKRRGKGSDPTVGFVVDYTERPWRIVRFDFIPGGDADWEGKYRLIESVYREYGCPYVLVDVTGTQDSVQEALQNRGVEVEGIHFGGNGNKKFEIKTFVFGKKSIKIHAVFLNVQI